MGHIQDLVWHSMLIHTGAFYVSVFALFPSFFLSKKIFFVRDTSGVLVMALNAGVHRTLSMAFEAREVDKIYIALVDAHLEHQVLK